MARYKTKILMTATVAAAVYIVGCAPAVQQARDADEADGPPVTETEISERYSADKRSGYTFLDTLNRGKEVSLAASDVSVLEVEVMTGPVAQPGAGFTEIPVETPPRFRVQILASSQVDMVRKEKLTVEAVTSLPVTMASEQSLYKLFVGDFKSKEAAEAALPEIRKMGYRDAWVVSTK